MPEGLKCGSDVFPRGALTHVRLKVTGARAKAHADSYMESDAIRAERKDKFPLCLHD